MKFISGDADLSTEIAMLSWSNQWLKQEIIQFEY